MQVRYRKQAPWIKESGAHFQGGKGITEMIFLEWIGANNNDSLQFLQYMVISYSRTEAEGLKVGLFSVTFG